MGYYLRTQDEILTELKEFSESPTTLIEGTFAMDIYSANALEFSKTETELMEIYRNSFLDTCANEYLDLRAHEIGVYRREGKRAVGKLTVTGNGTVRAGAYFATEENVRFVATSETKVVDSAEIDIEALVEGAESNVAAGTINRIPLNIPGIRSCTNAEATYDGYDEENDTSLRERALMRIRYPAASGNPRHYIDWALEVTGVGAVRVQRAWAGAGTVKVIIIDANFESANVDLLARVTEKIEAERPIGAEVTVVSAERVPIDISAKVLGSIDLDAFTANVNSYLINLTNQTLTAYENIGILDYVSLAKIGSFIINAGADDYSELKLNGEGKNVALSFDDIPALGEVNFM